MKTLFTLIALALAYVASAQLNPDFSPNHDVSVCGPNTVYFVCISPATPDNIWWDFGDGTTTTGINPSHYYSTTGSYDVKMIVQKDGVKDSITKTAFVQVRPMPESHFKVEKPQHAQIPFTRKMVFNGFSNADSISQFTWKIDDTEIQCDDDVLNYVFAGNGEYAVSLTVLNNKGCSHEFTDTVSIADSVIAPVGLKELNGNAFSVSTLYDQSTLLLKRNEHVNEKAAIRIYDITGKLVASRGMQEGESESTIAIGNLHTGTYIIEYSSVSYNAARRFSKTML